jgi:hypothetical protein
MRRRCLDDEIPSTNDPSEIPEGLSPALVPLLYFELSHENVIIRVDRKQWSNSPLVVVFRDPLHIDAAERELRPGPDNISRWENRDTHYDLEAGWRCNQTGQCLSGPLPKGD